jgi:hypothetical protein
MGLRKAFLEEVDAAEASGRRLDSILAAGFDSIVVFAFGPSSRGDPGHRCAKSTARYLMVMHGTGEATEKSSAPCLRDMFMVLTWSR